MLARVRSGESNTAPRGFGASTARDGHAIALLANVWRRYPTFVARADSEERLAEDNSRRESIIDIVQNYIYAADKGRARRSRRLFP